jgi:hypothetical protein
MSDDTWPTLLQHVLKYITLLTNLEGPAPSAPTLIRKEIIEHNTTRKESRAAAIAAAAAADSNDGGGGGGGGDAALGQGPVTRTRGHKATQPAAPPRRRLEGQGAAGGEKEEVSLLWAALSPGTIAMVARGMKHS